MVDIFKGVASGAERARLAVAGRKKLKLDMDKAIAAQQMAATKEARLQSAASLDQWESASKFQDSIWDMVKTDGPVNMDEIMQKMNAGKQVYGRDWYIDNVDLLMDLHATPGEIKRFLGNQSDRRLSGYEKQYKNIGQDPTDVLGIARGKTLQKLRGHLNPESQQKHQMSIETNKIEFQKTLQASAEQSEPGANWRESLSSGAGSFENNREKFKNNPALIGEWLSQAQGAGAQSGFSQGFVDDTLKPYYDEAVNIRATSKAMLKDNSDKASDIQKWNTSLRLTTSAVNAEIARLLGAKEVSPGMDGTFKINFEGVQIEEYKKLSSRALPYIIAGLSQPEIIQKLNPNYQERYPEVSYKGNRLDAALVRNHAHDIYDEYGFVYHNNEFMDPVTKKKYPAETFIQMYLTALDNAEDR